jgi:uncharacterized spore protein YtfJ
MKMKKNKPSASDELKKILVSSVDKALRKIQTSSVLGEKIVTDDTTVVEIKNVSVGITDKKDRAQRHRNKYLVIKDGKVEIKKENPLE